MTNIVCIGSVLWDVIGRSDRAMAPGSDVPGRIERRPGGVALNIAMALRKHGLRPALLSSVGTDAAGNELETICAQAGLETAYLYRPDRLPTDVYMAIEAQGTLMAAVADAHSLERAGEAILASLKDGRLGSSAAPFEGTIVLDGNLVESLLAEIANDACFSCAKLRVAPASPGKAERLRPFLSRPNSSLYLNLEEACILLGERWDSAPNAAEELVRTGASRVLVTHGAHMACDASSEQMITALPPKVIPRQVTGAGDAFVAAHIAAELTGASRQDALDAALATASAHVAGDVE